MNYLYYGTKARAQEVVDFVNHVLKVNEQAEDVGRKKTPICIWGKHGIGKTEIVESMARENGYQFAYIAPAQFEEMGDLIGMPTIEHEQTVFRAPEWVPTEEGPGILLIDDVNRADDRILRGIMQLLQNYELVSWKLPKGWHIILTANPDGGDYSVTPMDDAMLTRLMHITLEFDAKEWAHWAEENQIDSRGINFVLTYPEVVSGHRTTPRTLVQFFEAISHIEDLGMELPLVQILGDSCLDSQTVAAFISFVNHNLASLISPEQILAAEDFPAEVRQSIEEVVMKDTLRVDILATLATRLVNHLKIRKRALSDSEMKNLKAFIKLDFLPNDIRLAMAQDLVSAPQTELASIMTDPEIGKILLERM
jgi:hypothetical protein